MTNLNICLVEYYRKLHYIPLRPPRRITIRISHLPSIENVQLFRTWCIFLFVDFAYLIRSPAPDIQTEFTMGLIWNKTFYMFKGLIVNHSSYFCRCVGWLQRAAHHGDCSRKYSQAFFVYFFKCVLSFKSSMVQLSTVLWIRDILVWIRILFFSLVAFNMSTKY